MRSFRWKCRFCGTKNGSNKKNCKTCTAPVKKAEVTPQSILKTELFGGDD